MTNIFNKLARAEEEFKNSEFVAPIFSDRVVVSIAGITSTYKVRPSDFRGWGILRPMANKLARVTNEAPRQLINKYQKILPKFTMVVCDIEKKLGFISNTDNRISINQPLPFYLGDNIAVFDNINVFFDGCHFIFGSKIRSQPGSIDLNLQLSQDVPLNDLVLSKGHKEAYEYVYYKKQKELLGNKENQLKSAIERGGGKYISYSDINNNETKVSYEINGQLITTTLGDNLNVMSAGICLSGGDREFDLQSLVTVVKEAQQTSHMVVGDYYDYYNR